MRRAPEGLRHEAFGHEAVPRFVPWERDRLEQGASPDEQEFNWDVESDDTDSRPRPPWRHRARDGSDDPGQGDVPEARVEYEVRRREETLSANGDVPPNVPIEAECLEQQPGEREPEDGPSGDAGQRTKEARDVHRSALAAPPPSSGRYFKVRRSRGSRLGSDSMDRDQ